MPDSIQTNGRFHLDECQINAGYLLSTYLLYCLFGQLKSCPLHFLAQWRLKSFVHLTRSPSELCKTKRVACRQLQHPSRRRFSSFRGLCGSRCKYVKQASLVLAIFVVLGEMHRWFWKFAFCGLTLGFTDHPCYQVSSGATRKQGCVFLACI